MAADSGSAALLWFCSKAAAATGSTGATGVAGATGATGGMGATGVTAALSGPGGGAPGDVTPLQPSILLARAASLVGGSAYLWELAAAASAIGLLEELHARSHLQPSSPHLQPSSPHLRLVAAQLRRAGALRMVARLPNLAARRPIGWDAARSVRGGNRRRQGRQLGWVEAATKGGRGCRRRWLARMGCSLRHTRLSLKFTRLPPNVL